MGNVQASEAAQRGWISFFPFKEEETETGGWGKIGEQGKNWEGREGMGSKWIGEPAGYQAKLGQTDQLCELRGPTPDISRPLLHHLQKGNNHADLIGLLWGEMRKCACSPWPGITLEG